MDPHIVALVLLGAYLLYKVVSFAKSYADLTLLSLPKTPPNAFSDKVVWVIGASQGLGEELALSFARQGAKLVLSSRSADKLQAVKTACSQFIPPSHIHILPFDITSSPATVLLPAVESAFTSTFDGQGVDYVVFNAGASQHAAAETTSASVAAQLVSLNLLGQIILAQETLRRMVDFGKKGHHVVIASMSAVVPSPGQAIYAATKSGLRAYFASVASELADKGITVTVCCPGPIATGTDENKPRSVYGSDGLVLQSTTGMNTKRISPQLAAELILKAVHHRVHECWIAYHPVLLIGYVMQYLPSVGMKILKKIGPGRVRQMKEGKGGYDVRGMMFSSSQKSQK